MGSSETFVLPQYKEMFAEAVRRCQRLDGFYLPGEILGSAYRGWLQQQCEDLSTNLQNNNQLADEIQHMGSKKNRVKPFYVAGQAVIVGKPEGVITSLSDVDNMRIIVQVRPEENISLGASGYIISATVEETKKYVTDLISRHREDLIVGLSQALHQASAELSVILGAPEVQELAKDLQQQNDYANSAKDEQ